MRSLVLLASLLSAASAASANSGEWRSAYTDTDASGCTILASEPGRSSELACPGYKGYPVLIRDGDLRMFVSYGVGAREEKAYRQTLPGFSTIGERIEWLIEDRPGLGEQPVATILRFRLDRSEGFMPDIDVLVVTRVAPGNTCHVAYIDAMANPDANDLARKAAAELAPVWNCAEMQARWVGNADPYLSGQVR